MSKHIITGTFKSRPEANAAVSRLLASGFPERDISVLMSDATKGREFSVETKSKMSEGAAVGGVSGGALGAIVAGLAAVGALAIPGVGILAAGPVVAALAGMAAGGAAGGAVGALIGLGIPEHQAKIYADELKNGGILIGVHTDSSERAELARDVFRGMDVQAVRG